VNRPFLFFWIIFGLLSLFYFVYLPVLTRYRDIKMEEERMVLEIDDLNRKILALAEEKNLLQNDIEYLEKVIRDELGLVKPGETVYKFVTEQPETNPGDNRP